MAFSKKQKNYLINNHEICTYLFRDIPSISGVRNGDFTELFKKLVKAQADIIKFVGIKDEYHTLWRQYLFIAANPFRTDEEDDQLDEIAEELEDAGIDISTFTIAEREDYEQVS